MKISISEDELKKLFSKSYGEDAPSLKKWEKFYNKDVLFIDPTQKTYGLNSYVAAQEKLVKRCEDLFLETHNIAMTKDNCFIEWTLGLKIQKKEFIYPGVSRLIFGKDGKIVEHRDYFDFVGPTFKPIPFLGAFIKWLYSKFVS